MLRNLWHHFLLITRHRHKVIAHCKKAGILWQGLRHDLSKYSPTTKVETAITLNTGRTTTPWKRKSCP